MNWHVSGASALSDTVAAPSSSSSLDRPNRGGGCCAVAAKQIERRLLGDRIVLRGVTGIHFVNDVPGHSLDRLALGKRLRQLDLQRVHRGDVMHDNSNLAAVAGDACLPLGVRERGCEINKRARSLFEAFGQRLRAAAGSTHCVDFVRLRYRGCHWVLPLVPPCCGARS